MKQETDTHPVDAHCHLDFEQFESDREDVIKKINNELEFVVNAGVNPEHNVKTLALAEENEKILPALGLHPVYTESFSELEKVKQQLMENDAVAVGEIGLDHHHVTDEEERENQKEVFEELVKFAEKHGLPVVVHSREAEKEAVEILINYDVEVLLHCFNGTPELAKKASEEGMKIGVTTQVLYSTRVQRIVENVALEDVVLETDSPYLYPEERNEPVHVKESAEEIAEIKSCELGEVVEATNLNSEKLFH